MYDDDEDQDQRQSDEEIEVKDDWMEHIERGGRLGGAKESKSKQTKDE